MKPVRIDFACNDPDNGNFTGQVEAVQLMDGMLELESWGRPRRLVDLGGKIRFSGKTWPITGSKYGVGNWSWDGYLMKPPVAVDFLVWLHGRRLFDCTAGWDVLYDLWQGDAPLDRDAIFESLA